MAIRYNLYKELPANNGLDLDAVINRLEYILNNTDAALLASGAAWYANRHGELRGLSAVSGIDVETLAYVCSALSPNTGWAKNYRALLHMVGEWTQGHECPTTETLYHANDRKAWAILNSPDAATTLIGQGWKTQAFAPNLLERGQLPDGGIAVTVDTVYHQAATGVVPKNGIGHPVYRVIRKATIFLAKKYGVEPYVLQATGWCAYRGTAE